MQILGKTSIRRTSLVVQIEGGIACGMYPYPLIPTTCNGTSAISRLIVSTGLISSLSQTDVPTEIGSDVGDFCGWQVVPSTDGSSARFFPLFGRLFDIFVVTDRASIRSLHSLDFSLFGVVTSDGTTALTFFGAFFSATFLFGIAR